MTNSDTGKKPASNETPASQKPGAELNENELDEVSGGSPIIVVLGKNHQGKKPFKMTSP